ncbi:hypothetical protein OsI_25595 [Oryza sativa Indica Group]|uniref:Uncharacterized protein n=1 Tax=Oryza sativa subsp. indica TaxID=39946 RepID=A2YK46_ORYSI|nr:hypothetical protein OsI_25595 [Oryza sativa Indica Group]
MAPPMQEGEERPGGSACVWMVTALLLLSVLAGGGCLAGYLVLPPHEAPHWLPAVGLALVALPWAFWVATCSYRSWPHLFWDETRLTLVVLIRVIQDANEGDEGGIKFDELHVQIDSNWRIAKDLDEFDMVLRLCMNADISPLLGNDEKKGCNLLQFQSKMRMNSSS